MKEEEKLPTVHSARKAPAATMFRQKVVTKFRKWKKGIRVLATVLQATKNFKNSIEQNPPEKRPMPVDKNEVENAIIELVKEVQATEFREEIQAIKTVGSINKSSPLKTLTPVFDEHGQLVVNGRLALACLEETEKRPIILPANHPITERVLLKCHEDCMHAGVHQTLYLVRTKFWTMGGHRYARTALNTCQWCRLKRAKPLKQQMAPLPKERTSMQPPFSSVGVDFAGPIPYYEKGGKGEHARKKAYICLFSCMSTRGVHLELVPSLETQAFVAAFRNLIGRRGWPEKVISDSALTFKRASKDLKLRCEDIQWLKVIEEIDPSFAGINWSFNCPKASWWGGVFERTIGLVKERLNLGLRSSKLSFIGLQTVLIEVEAIVNSRPISCLRTDPDAPTAITPGHLMTGRMLMVIPDANVKNVEDVNVLQRLRHQQALTRQFWESFRRDYLQELQRRLKWQTPTDLAQLEGKVVVVREESVTKKCHWPMGVVLRAIAGRDGLVRSCEVRLANGKMLRRPVQKLALIAE